MKNMLKNKNKNLKLTTLGFTLVELLTILLLICLISMIIFISYNTLIKEVRDDTYQRQVDSIIESGKSWALNNSSLLSKDNNNIISVSELLNQKYLDAEKIINPKTENQMQGCVIITWDESYNQYIYEYEKNNSRCSN